MAKNYTLRLKLPVELNAAQQRTIEGTEITVTRGEGYVGPLTDNELRLAQADPYVVIDDGEVAEGGENTPPAPKPPTKKELIAAAEADGLKLEVTDKNTVAEITAAIEAARNAGETDPATDGEVAEGGENTDQE